ncbi:hypothetical protein D3C73_1062170 [compost metagenome]
MARLDLRRRRLSSSLYAPGIGRTQARADVSQIGVVGVVVLVEEVEDTATIERRRHEHAALGEITIGMQRGFAIEAGVEPAVGLGAVDAPGAEIGGDLRFILAARLEGIVQMFDRGQACIHCLFHRQRHRNMA